MPQTNPSDTGSKLNVVDVIMQVAREMGIPPILALAIAQHESGLNPHIVGDNGHSVGLFQLNDQGEGAGKSVKWRSNPWNNARTALRVVAKVLKEHPDWTWGQVAAAAQRPAEPQAYASTVDNYVHQAKGWVTGKQTDPLNKTDHGTLVRTFFSNKMVQQGPVPPESFNNNKGGGGANNGGNGGGGGGNGGNNGVDNNLASDGGNNNGAFSEGGGRSTDSQLIPSLSKRDFRQGLNAAGFAMQLIKSDPELYDVFQRALQHGWYKTDTGLSRFQSAVKNTHWWQSRTPTQRSFDEQFLNPAEHKGLKHQINQGEVSLRDQMKTLGVKLTDAELQSLVKLGIRNGLSPEQVAHQLASHYDYHKDLEQHGTAATAVDEIQRMAAAYNVPVSHDQMQHWVQQVLAGSLQTASLIDHFKQVAMSLYPGLSQQITNGQTVSDVADAYRTRMSDILELNPAAVTLKDPMIQKALTYTQDQTKPSTLMPLWQFEQQIRQDPRWLQTSNAKQSAMDTGVQILRDWGLTA